MNTPYADTAWADEYHAARQSAERWNDFSETEQARRLVSAADVIDRLFDDYAGEPAEVGQIRAFPRKVGGTVRGLPYALRAANCELALLDDVSGSLPDAAKLKSIGGVLLKNGKCGAEDAARHSALAAVLPLLDGLRERKTLRLKRG